MRLQDVKETALYVDDLPRAKRFYEEVMGLSPLVSDARFCALNVNGRHVLLLFERGSSTAENHLPGGTIPPHDGSGPVHIGFSIDTAEMPEWQENLRQHGVEVLSGVKWPRGGYSIYFRDPDGHLLELLTPGVWTTY